MKQLAFAYLPWRKPHPESTPLRLTARRLYILPTRAGVVFALLLLGLLIGAINYGLSLAYLFTFWFAGLAVTGMLYTQRNLSGLVIRSKTCSPVFTGETANVALEVTNPSRLPRYRIGLSHTAGSGNEADIAAGDKADLTLHLPCTHRGWQTLGRFSVYSRYPFGLFRCWCVLELLDASDAQPFGVLVYPTPAHDFVALPNADYASSNAAASRSDGDDFTGLRTYQAGDPPQRIAWKTAARSQHLLTKQFSGQRGSQLRLDWSRTPEKETEARLSRLTRWALDAHAAGIAFELTLPNASVAMGSGEGHLRMCLETLARWGK